MNFDLSDEQREIKQTARRLLSERSSFERIRATVEGGGDEGVLWDEIADLGWTGIGIAEHHDGSGFGTVELAVLAEELGYAVAPCRFLGNALAGVMIGTAGSEDQQARWLPGIASGSAPGTLGFARDGVAELAPDAPGAAIVILVEDGGAVAAHASDATIEPRESIDPTRGYGRISIESGEPLDGPVALGVDRAEVVLAAELVGVAQRALELTVEYVKTRKQFGQPVGAFQAVSHRCAEMLLETEGARSAVYGAAWAADADTERLPFAASVAKAAAADAARYVTAAAIQLHGGIGFTWEANVHWLFKRAHLDAAQLGSAHEHRARLALLAAGISEPAARLA